MKRTILNLLFGLLFLAGFGILAYPTVSDQWNTYRQSRLISDYETAVSPLKEEDFEKVWEEARSYNGTFEQNSILSDVFGIDEAENIRETEYWKVLNVTGNGIMGYLSVPKINIKLSIYHGTSDEVLDTGVGHLNGTKLPMEARATTASCRPTGDCPVQSFLQILISWEGETGSTCIS